jgi:hypothetical protein
VKTNTKTKTGEPKNEDAVLAADAGKLIGDGVEDFEGFAEAEFAEVAFLHFEEEAFQDAGVDARKVDKKSQNLRRARRSLPFGGPAPLADSPMQSPVRNFHESMSGKNFQALRGLHHPAPHLEDALAPAPAGNYARALSCFRGTSVNRSLIVHNCRPMPNTARTNAYAGITRQAEAIRPVDCCLRPSPRSKTKNKRDLVRFRFPPTRHHSPFIASIRFPTLRCQMLEALAEPCPSAARDRAYAYSSCDVRPVKVKPCEI